MDNQIKPIIELCDSLNIHFVLSVIPSLDGNDLKKAESVNGLFENIEYHQATVAPDMYEKDDGHFNNEDTGFMQTI